MTYGKDSSCFCSPQGTLNKLTVSVIKIRMVLDTGFWDTLFDFYAAPVGQMLKMFQIPVTNGNESRKKLTSALLG